MNKEGKIESILNSLDGIHRATPGYFFFTRVQARLDNTRNFAEGVIRFITRPAIAVAAVLLIIIINGYAIFNTFHNTTNTPSTSEIAAVNEYSQMNTISFSEVEKLNP